MIRAGEALVRIVRDRPVDVFAVVHRGQSFEVDLHTFGQALVSGVHAGEQGVAADRRHRVQIKNAAHRRLGVHGQVRMPVVAGDVFRIGIRVDRDDVRMAPDRGDAAMDRQIAEQAAESLVAVVVEMLVAEEDHLVFGDGLNQLLDRRRLQRPGEVDAGNLRADAQRQRCYLDQLIAHGVSGVLALKGSPHAARNVHARDPAVMLANRTGAVLHRRVQNIAIARRNARDQMQLPDSRCFCPGRFMFLPLSCNKPPLLSPLGGNASLGWRIRSVKGDRPPSGASQSRFSS